MDSAKTQKNRPLSPHLQIYKPQITSVLSILHRLTGGMLYLGLVVLIWSLICYVYPQNWEECSLALFLKTNSVAICLFNLTLFAWTFALFYHLLNGIRHLFWDVGVGFSLCAATLSGYAVVISALFLSVLAWYAANALPLIYTLTS